MSLTAAPSSKADGLMLPPAPRAAKRKKVVLEEDEYVSKLEAILERDFFPDLPKLKNKLEWVTAVNSGDMNLIRQAQINIAKRRAGVQTPMVTGQTPMATPHTALFRTPAMTPLVQGPGSTSNATASTQPAMQLNQDDLKAPNLTLDEFLSSYTSEDNASFQQLQDDAQRRKELKHAHHLQDRPQPLLLTEGRPTDGYGTSGQPEWHLITWKHNPKNPHYYDSSNREDAPLTDKEIAEQAAGPPKQIQYNNTRLTANHEEPTPAEPPSSSAAAGQQQPSEPAAQLPAAIADMHPKGALGTQGYNYMPTPSLAPGVEDSPFMTWGMLGSTPLRLDGDDDLHLDLSDKAGPQFRMSQPSAREKAARSLAQKAAARQRSSKTPLLQRPGSGLKPLSEAGKKLASALRSGKTPGAVDSQLRSSYTPGSRSRGVSVQGTPKLGAGATPVPAAVGSGKARGIMQAGGSARQGDGEAGGNVTDGLLKL